MEDEGKVIKIKVPRIGKNFWKLSTLALAVLLIAAVWTGGFGITGAAEADTQPAPQAPAPQPQAPPEPEVYTDVDLDDDPVLGDEDAEVTIIEFSDYQCPFCARHVTQTVPQIKENYIDTGKVKLIFRDLPLGFHQYAHVAAEASECADDQGKFWEYHDLLFENAADLSEENLKVLAEDLGLDMDDFNSCLEDGTYEEEVDNDMSDASNYGITGTPSFLIGNEEKGYVKLVGAQPYEAFEDAIEEALA